MKLHCLTLGDYQTNCYLLHAPDSTACAIIDPGYDAPRILDAVRALGLTVDAILLTHGHFDHVGAVEALVKATGCALWLSRRDWSLPPDPLNLFYYPLANCVFTEVRFPEDGAVIRAGGLDFTVLETPGHTLGSVCYLCQESLFSGDTLFCRSCGRTDLPGGSWRALQDALARLRTLNPNLWVYPGHGEMTTLFDELHHNPYL